MLTDNIYVIGGITNAYADPTDPFDDSFDRFFNDGEHFKSLEIGWTESQQRMYQDNTHVTFWHVDDSTAAGAVEWTGGVLLSRTSATSMIVGCGFSGVVTPTMVAACCKSP